MENVIKYEYCNEENNSLMFLTGYIQGTSSEFPGSRLTTNNEDFSYST